MMVGEDLRASGRVPQGTAAGRRGRGWGGALVLLGVLATVALGRWQLDRAAQKDALAAAWQMQAGEPALQGAGALPPDAGSARVQAYRRVQVQGQWDATHTVYLDNRPMGERAGLWVYTPLRLDTGRPADAVLVQRGWIPRNSADREAIAPYRTTSGPVEVHGHLAPFPAARVALGAEATGAIRQNLDPEALGRAAGLTLRPLLIVQDDEGRSPPGEDGLLRAWERPRADVHKHYAYAAQWFAMAALIVAYPFWLRRRARHEPTQPSTLQRR